MIYLLDSTIKNKMHDLCNDHGFTSKGKVFFRIYSDTILQAISFQYEHAFSHYSLNVGLMSLYSDAEDSLLSAQSALPRYSSCCLENYSNAVSIDKNHEFVSFSIRSPEDQLCLLDKYGFKWLDEIVTQEDLLRAINFLERVSYKAPIWNNELKLSPFLAVEDYYSADFVIASILTQQLGPCAFSFPPWSEEDFIHYSLLFPNKNNDLIHLHKLIANKSVNSINNYLEENYKKNTDRLRFLKKT